MVKVFLLTGGLMIADFGFHYSGLYESSPYWQIPIEFFCRIGYALGFLWVFVFSGNAKEHLRQRFPRCLVRIFDKMERKGVKTLDADGFTTNVTNTSSGAQAMTAM